MSVLDTIKRIMAGPRFFRQMLRFRKSSLKGRLGLSQRLALAETGKEVAALLREGESYKGASDRTKRMWDRTARAKQKQFEAVK